MPISPVGYGRARHGLSPYGLFSSTPNVESVESLDGFNLEVMFSLPMLANEALVDSTNYVLVPTFGAPATVTGVTLGEGIGDGYISVTLEHTGTTLGGKYTLVVSGVESIDHQPLDEDRAVFLALGDETSVTVTVPDNQTLALEFKDSLNRTQSLLVTGAEAPSSYTITTDYPITMEPTAATLDGGDVSLTVAYMTTVDYTLVVNKGGGYKYDGSILPSSDPSLNGEVLGTGTSTISASLGLRLSKVSENTYGWFLGDSSGYLVEGSSYRVDFTINLASTVIDPALEDAVLATLSVSDGQVQLYVNLAEENGSRVLQIESGSLSEVVVVDWQNTAITISVLRNQQGGFYTILVDGIPVSTFAIEDADGEAIQDSGAVVLLEEGYTVTNFRVQGVDLVASSTVYTSSWNFVHGISADFEGLESNFARNKILTKRGPLVRGWGDSTPATLDDVEVRVNGVSVALAALNPYIGEITLVLPLPLTPAGTNTVEVDYVWRSNPEFGLAGLNTPGLTLNNWMRGVKGGRAAVGDSTSRGAAPTARFPMGVVLNRPSWSNPRQVGHTYIGYQREYTALSNDPTTLLLNSNPHAISTGKMSATALVQTGLFNGRETPVAESWTLTGTDTGEVIGDGTYSLEYPLGAAGLYAQAVDLSLPTFVTEIARFKIATVPSLYGVFTGIGFGVHDGRRLCLVGALEVSGVRHLGILINANRPDLESSWVIGPSSTATALTQNSIRLTTLPAGAGAGAGVRFRVAEGAQAGIYTVDTCGVSLDTEGEVVLSFTPELPETISTFGGGAFQLFFETNWGGLDLVSIRITTGFPSGSIIAYVGGALSGLIGDVEQTAAYPAETALLLPALTPTGKGVVFWGGLSRLTSGSSIWDLVQYASNPTAMASTVQGITVESDMDSLPQDDGVNLWFVTGGYGYSSVESGVLLLSSTASSEELDFEYSLSRIEPHLNPKRTTDLQATYKIESGVLGSGDAQLRIRDTVREVLLTNLLYVETEDSRHLINDLPKVSLSGLRSPELEGWVTSDPNTLSSVVPAGLFLTVVKASGETGLWTASSPDPSVVGYEGVVLEARLQLTEVTVGAGDLAGPIFGAMIAGGVDEANVVTVVFAQSPTRIIFTNGSGDTLLAVPFSWDDDETHTYRLVCDPDADLVSVFIDDDLQDTVALTDFPTVASDSFQAFFGAAGDGVSTARWHSLSAVALRPLPLDDQTIGRTFGFWLGRDADDIDSYVIPRSDEAVVKNSSLEATPVSMDWREYCEVRLYLDPTWGVGLYRPDVAAPPWASVNYTTETTDPSNAWANVEYRRLPRAIVSRGEVSFGSLDSRSISQQRWDTVSYRIRARPYGAGIASTGMVLNRATTFKSPDLALQKAPEVARVPLRSPLLAVIYDAALFAARVFVVQDEHGNIVPSTNWSFDKDTQQLVFSSPVSGDSVNVTFAPGDIVTQNYLCTRPIDQIQTVLNEGTPPVPKKRGGPISRSVVEDEGTGGDKVVFAYDDSSRYAGLEFCETEDGDRFPIAIMSDGPGLGEGLAEIGLDGTAFTNAFSVDEGPAGPFRGSPTFRGSSSHFPGVQLIAAGGGKPWGRGMLNTATLYPNARGPAGTIPADRMGLNRDFVFLLRDTQEENWTDFADDNTSPEGNSGSFENGICSAVLMDFLGVSRLGPWGGLAALQLQSLLAGGSQLNGTQFVLSGGSPIIPPVVTNSEIEASNWTNPP